MQYIGIFRFFSCTKPMCVFIDVLRVIYVLEEDPEQKTKFWGFWGGGLGRLPVHYICDGFKACWKCFGLKSAKTTILDSRKLPELSFNWDINPVVFVPPSWSMVRAIYGVLSHYTVLQVSRLDFWCISWYLIILTVRYAISWFTYSNSIHDHTPYTPTIICTMKEKLMMSDVTFLCWPAGPACLKILMVVTARMDMG